MTERELLELLERSHQIQRDDIRETGENHMDLSERVLANLSVVRTITDGTELLRLMTFAAAQPDPTS